MFKDIKKAMEMKAKYDQLTKEMAKIIIEYNEVRGIKVKLNGAMMFQSIEVEDSWLDPKQKARLQMEMVKAINMAMKKAQKEVAMHMKKTGGFDIPGLM